jgi:small-conductance mechanosensitive channel
MPRLSEMGTPPAELPVQPPQTQVVGQQSSPSTVVPTGGYAPDSTKVAGRRINTLAVVCLVTALIAPFGHVTGVFGIALILTSIVTGHMARAEIRRTGEDGATLALIGLIISYVHVVVAALITIFFFGVVIAFLAAILHFVATSAG